MLSSVHSKISGFQVQSRIQREQKENTCFFTSQVDVKQEREAFLAASLLVIELGSRCAIQDADAVGYSTLNAARSAPGTH